MSHSNHQKYLKEKSSCVRRQNDSFKVLEADDSHLFPLSWTNDSLAITGYDLTFLTLEEKRIFLIYRKFEVRDFHEVIRLWLGDENHLTACLGELYYVSICRYLQKVFVIFAHSFAYQMVKISTEERRQRSEKIKVVSSSTNNPQSHLEGFNFKGRKRPIEEPTPNSSDVKDQRLKEGISYALNTYYPIIWKVNTQVPSIGEAPSPPTTFWSNVGFYTLQFKNSYLPFSKQFYANYQTLCSKQTSTIVSMKGNLLLRVLVLQDVDQEMLTMRTKGC